jgi:DNA-binding NarL/FixJ family response regulator
MLQALVAWVIVEPAGGTRPTGRVAHERIGEHAVSQLRVLIVDDHPYFRSAAAELLASRGYEVVGEADCEAGALERMERLVPDAVLLDVNLGEGFGPRLCARLIERRPSLAVLLVSSDAQDATTDTVLASGARGIVAKAELARTDLSRFFERAGG